MKSSIDAKYVEFKSIPINWDKEENNRKPNTFRKIDETDERFILLRSFNPDEDFVIGIKNTKTNKIFKRLIKDVTEWEGYMIISWVEE